MTYIEVEKDDTQIEEVGGRWLGGVILVTCRLSSVNYLLYYTCNTPPHTHTTLTLRATVTQFH